MGDSLGSAITGIDANQALLDNIGNNIANVNTVGYQSTDLQFSDLLYQQQSSAGAPQPGVGGGTNPVVVGSGVRVSASPTNFSQGTLQETGVSTDVAIQGQGFLIASQGGQSYYTRAGNLQLDANGNLVTPTGAIIQGWLPTTPGGTIATNGALSAITIPQGQQSGANPTTTVTLGGNLPPSTTTTSTSTPPASFTSTVSVFDSLGNAIPITFTYTSTGSNTYSLAWAPSGSTTAPTSLGTITFSPTTGQVTGTPTATLSIPAGTTSPPASAISAKVDFSALTQLAGASSVAVTGQNGFASGSLQKFTINSDGTIQGSYSNGQTQTIGQIALASFANEQGLTKVGNLLYATSANSGLAQVGTAGSGGRGALVGGSVEGSNVNLGDQLTELIIAQNAYQANTKVVSTSSTVLQSLVQMA